MNICYIIREYFPILNNRDGFKDLLFYDNKQSANTVLDAINEHNFDFTSYHIVSRNVERYSNIRQINEKFYFVDEAEQLNGPYDDEMDAFMALDGYIKSLG